MSLSEFLDKQETLEKRERLIEAFDMLDDFGDLTLKGLNKEELVMKILEQDYVVNQLGE